MNILSIAHLGDAVYELCVREYIAAGPPMNVNDIHKKTVALVCAAAQSKAYDVIEPVLNQAEADMLRRGRNNSSSKVPKNADCKDYRRATAVEALFGFLYVTNDIGRINELFSLIIDELTKNL